MVTMIPIIIPPEVEEFSGEIIASNVSLEDFEKYYAEDFCEWIEGHVIKMSTNIKHDKLLRFFAIFFESYFEHRPIAQIVQATFMMKNPAFPKRRREPDLQLVLNTSSTMIQDTYVDGPANIIIEIISPESVARDYGDKFLEYEIGGVREYWIFDPQRKECRFHRLNDDNLYQTIQPIEGIYTTSLLPDFVLDISLLWQESLPTPSKIAEMVKAMVGK